MTRQLLGATRWLSAATLGFAHPITGEQISLASPLPADFTAVLDRLLLR